MTGPLSDVTNKDNILMTPCKDDMVAKKLSGLSLQSPAPHMTLDDDVTPVKPWEPQEDTTCTPAKEPVMTDYKRRELSGELKPEPLLKENYHRYVIFPIHHADVSS